MEEKGGIMSKVSVIIPSFGRPDLLKRAIKSVLDQTFQDFEIIVVDDNDSGDIKNQTQRIVEDYCDERIVYIKNEKNMGSNFSRNVGLRRARGEYIAFLDDDDFYFTKNKIRNQIELFKRNKKIGFVGCGYYDKYIGRERIPNLRGKIDKKLLITFSYIETSTIMIKRDVIKKTGFFDEKLLSEQNHDFFYRISKIAEFDYLLEIAVIKGAPPERITSNIKKRLKGYTMFHKKHFKDIWQLKFRDFVFVTTKFVVTIFIFIIVGISRNPKILPKLYEKMGKIRL